MVIKLNYMTPKQAERGGTGYFKLRGETGYFKLRGGDRLL
jgi:hypothetical protein